MKVVKSIGLVILVILLLVAMLCATNHTAAFWRLIKEESSPYLRYCEDFSDLIWTESAYGSSGASKYTSQTDVVVIPFGGTFSTEGNFLTVYLDERQINYYPVVQIPFDRVNAKENFVFSKMSYFVVTFDLWTESIAPRMVYMRNRVYNSYDEKSIATLDKCNLAYEKGFYKNSRDVYSTYTFTDKTISMSNSRYDRDKICAIVSVDNADISKSTITYYLNGIENELSYTDWITDDSDYISHFELSLSKPNKSCSISFDNFKVYIFDKGYIGDIKDVLKEVNYR